jgi:hypothetical protein
VGGARRATANAAATAASCKGLTLVHLPAQRYTHFVGDAGWRQCLPVTKVAQNELRPPFQPNVSTSCGTRWVLSTVFSNKHGSG